MKARTEETHEASELMRVLGPELLEEKRVYGSHRTKRTRRHAHPRLRLTDTRAKLAAAS